MAGTPEQHIYVLKNQLNESGTALEEETRQKVGIKTENEKLTAELQKQKEAYAKLEKHAKNCEKATNKAQKDVKNTKGYSDHVINSQKGNLRSAEKRAEESTRDLKAWRDKYGWSVEKPAEEKYALQMRVSEWQSKAEKARNEIASLEKQIEGTPEQVGLHQALEEWEEHQGCSAGFADLEDTIHDLKSELTTSKENYQKARSDIKPLQIKADQLEQAKKTLQELQVKADQLEQVNQAFQQLQIKADELEQASKAWHDQDKTQEYILHIQKLESDLEQHQKTEGELKALKDKTQEYILHIQKLESDLEQHQKTEGEMKALQEKVHYLEQASEAFHDQGKTDIDMLDDDMLDKERLESDLKALQDRHQKTESEMETLQEKAGQLEQANIAFQDQDDSHKDMLQKLDSDLKTTKEQLQKTESDMEALQGKADQLETLQGMVDQLNSDLKTTKEQLQTTESDMEALQGKADKLETLQGMVDQLKSDLKTTKDQLQITESDMAALQGKADQLESELENTEEQDPTTESDEVTVEEMANQLEALSGILDQQESELNETKEAFQRIKTDKKELQEKADQLEQANKAFQEKEDERLLAMLLEDEKPRDKEIKDAVQRSIEERTQLIAQAQASKKPEQDIKTQQVRVETPEKAERSQVTPPSSPTYTTDEGSQDLEKTPRPKKSLRQDLGYSSRDQSDEEQSDFFMLQQQRAKMSKQAETGEEKKGAGAETWETDNSEDDEEHTKGSILRETKKPLPFKRHGKELETLDIRATERTKEQAEALETLFECTPAKANAIDRRLKALGPGCRLHEAPALVAYELSGIPEDTYKGLASGQLIATIPLNEVKDVGTKPVAIADDMPTDNTDLPAEDVARPVFIAKDMATNTTDLYVKGITLPYTMSSRRAFFLYILMLLLIFFGLFCLYVGLKPDPKPKTQHGILYKNIYSHRHAPFPTPSLYAPTPITFVFPPTPALQLGLRRALTGSSLGGGWKGRL